MRESVIESIKKNYLDVKKEDSLVKFFQQDFPGSYLVNDPNSPHYMNLCIRDNKTADDVTMYVGIPSYKMYAEKLVNDEEVSVDPSPETTKALEQFLNQFPTVLNEQELQNVREILPHRLQGDISNLVTLTMPSEYDLNYNENYLGYNHEHKEEDLIADIAEVAKELNDRPFETLAAMVIKEAYEALYDPDTDRPTIIKDNTSVGEISMVVFPESELILKNAQKALDVIVKQYPQDQGVQENNSLAKFVLLGLNDSSYMSRLTFTQTAPFLSKSRPEAPVEELTAVLKGINKMLPGKSALENKQINQEAFEKAKTTIIPAAQLYVLSGGKLTAKAFIQELQRAGADLTPLFPTEGSFPVVNINMVAAGNSRALYMKENALTSMIGKFPGIGNFQSNTQSGPPLLQNKGLDQGNVNSLTRQ